jgi:hypothetical protein
MRIKFEHPQTNNSAKTIFRFEVRLLGGPISEAFVASHPEVPERVIDIKGTQTLDDLHLAIFKAFDRYDHHMYEFQIGGKKPMDRKAARYGIVLGDEFADEANGEDATVTPIASLNIKTGKLFFYWFDFGDDWWHEVRLLAVDPPAKGKGRYPRIVEKRGESPPQYVDWDAEVEEDALGTSTNAILPPENVAALLEKPRLDEISGLMTDFCESHLNTGYSTVCAQLFTAVRATYLSWQRGKAQSWAAGLVHAAGMINFLHDPASEPHMKLRDIAPYFGVSPATMENKSREIRNALNVFPLDPRFCLPERLVDSPLVWIRPLNGIMVDFRMLPREVQEEALKAGLIPFIPDPPQRHTGKDQQKSKDKETIEEEQPKNIKKSDQHSLLD